MLIQSIVNIAPAPQAAKPAKEGVAAAIAAHSLNPELQSATALPNAPYLPAKQADESKPLQQASAEQLKAVAENINKALKEAGRSLEFSVDKETNRQVFKLLDTETGEVIRQFPTEEMLAISRAMDLAISHAERGLLLKQEA